MIELVDIVRREVAHAVRSLRRDPALVIGVVVTLALAIGANAAMYGLVRRLLLPAPPGISEPSRVARLTLHALDDGGRSHAASTTSYPVFTALEARRDLFDAAAAALPGTMTMGRSADAIAVNTIAATGRYFDALGAHPSRGRFFGVEDDRIPAGSTVAVLSHSFWRRHFSGKAEVLGREIVLDDRTYTIVGVAAPDFTGDGLTPVDLFIPLTAALRSREGGWWNAPDINLVSVIARLRPGVEAQVAAAAARSSITAAQTHLAGALDLTLTLDPLLAHSTRSPQARITFWTLGVAFIVLLIATANVGTLLFLRAIRRRREHAVRMAIGAGRLRLAGAVIAESLLLALSGGALGLLLSQWLAELIRATLLPSLAPSERLADAGLVAVTAILSIGAGIIAGLAPLALMSHERLAGELHGAGVIGTVGRGRMQRTLVGVQVALCTLLLIGAGLFVRSLDRVRSQELGFSASRLLYVTLDFPTHLPGAESDAVHLGAVERLRDLPGVDEAAVAQAIPFGPHHIPPISVPGLAEPPSADGQLPMLYAATPEYLDVMGVRLLQGRLLTHADRAGSTLVVLVNETMAREVWPGRSALGQCIRVGFDPALPPAPMAPASLPCREVVGVVGDSRARSLRPVGREATLMQYYVPFGQLPAMPFGNDGEVSGILVRTDGDPREIMTAVQRRVQETASTPVRAKVTLYQDLLDPQMRPWRLGATLFGAFGLLALGIAAVGLWGVVSWLVTSRRREIGVRLALGGTSAMIGRSVVIGALRMVAIGIGAGVVVALIAGPGLQELLFETSARDAGVLVAAAGVLLLVAMASAAVPAWRAARVSPIIALRVEQ